MAFDPTWNDYKLWLGDALLSPLPAGSEAPKPTDFGSDSRAITSQTWFVPIKGENFDGNHFISQAMAAGAAGFMYERSALDLLDKALLAKGFMVTDGLTALQKIAAGWRRILTQTKIAAITGSVGKTTTKEMISCIFKHAGPSFATSGSFNNEVGVPKSLLQIKPSDQFAMLEFGAKRLGNIEFLCDMAKPDVAILLNVGVSHLGVFGSKENLRNTKLEIFRTSPKNAVLVANHDDPDILAGAIETGKQVISFGYAQDADVSIQNAEILPLDGKSNIELRWKNHSYTLNLNSCHSAFISNAAAAIAAALACGISIETAIKGLESFQAVNGRFRVLKGEGLIVIDDCYNANPDSMKAGLKSVFTMFPGKKINLLLGDMLELGQDSKDMHRDIGIFLKTFAPQKIFTVGQEAALIHDGFGQNGASFDNVEAAEKQSNDLTQGADVLFIKGSNGMRLNRFISHLQKAGILS